MSYEIIELPDEFVKQKFGLYLFVALHHLFALGIDLMITCTMTKLLGNIKTRNMNTKEP